MHYRPFCSPASSSASSKATPQTHLGGLQQCSLRARGVCVAAVPPRRQTVQAGTQGCNRRLVRSNRGLQG